MIDKPTYAELENRIKEVANYYGGTLPVEHALAWAGYIDALSEWGLITVDEHHRLVNILPSTPVAPLLCISLGPEGAHETMRREGISERVRQPKGKARPSKVRQHG